MIVIYEQGDVVYNNNNHNFAIVLKEFPDGTVRILEIMSDDDVMVNCPPKSALKYLGSMNLRDRMLDLVESVVDK
jgi:hypothetical protein